MQREGKKGGRGNEEREGDSQSKAIQLWLKRVQSTGVRAAAYMRFLLSCGTNSMFNVERKQS